MSIYTSQLQQFYMIYLGRPADPDGLAYWESAAASGHSMDSIAANFASSSEFGSQHANQTHRQLLNSIYQNLFGRPVDTEGLAYWSDALDHGMTADQAGLAILRGAQPADAAIIAAKTAAAASYTDMLAKQDGATANALLDKGALWLSVVTDAASRAAATAGLNDFVAHAFKPVVLDVRESYSQSGDTGYHWGGVSVNIVFSSAVFVDTSKGTPTLTMETGPNDAVATYVSGSGTNELVFNFRIKGDDNSADLDYTSSNALSLNGAVIKDAAGHDAVLTLPTPGAAHSLSANDALIIDTTPPLLLSVTPTYGDSGVLTNTNIELHFNEKMSKNGGSFVITSADHSQVINAYGHVSDYQMSIIFDPQVALHPNTRYIVTSSSLMHDISGNAWGTTQFDPEGYDPAIVPQVLISFKTGDTPIPALTAGAGVASGTLYVGGDSSGDPLSIDLNKHTASEGKVPDGAFTTVDLAQFHSAVKLQALDGADNQLTGTMFADTLTGGNALNGVAAHNVLRSGLGIDLMIAGAGSDNVFNYGVSESTDYSMENSSSGFETIGNWGAARSNTISFDGMTLAAMAAAGPDKGNPNFPLSMHIDAKGLATYDIAAGQQEDNYPGSNQFYREWYIDYALKGAPAGTSAVFNYLNDAYLVVVTGNMAPYADVPMNLIIKVAGVHSDGLVFDNQGHITTGSFIANG